MTWGARHHSSGAAGAGAPMPPSGKPLGKLNEDDLKTIIEKGLRLFSKFLYMGLVSRKLVFGVSDKVGLKPVSSATQTS